MIGRQHTFRLAATALCGLILAADPAGSSTMAGRVTGIEGTVLQRTMAKPFWHASAVQNQLQVGEFLRTSRGARAELTLADGNITRLGPTTILRLGGQEAPGILRLVLGKLYMKFSKSHSPLHIRTASMSAAVLGTEFLASVDENNASHVTVFAGQVEVTGSLGDKVTVSPGEWVEVEPNKPVGQPTAFGMIQLRKTDPLLRQMGAGLGVLHDDDVWR